jgi:hypothetical protein
VRARNENYENNLWGSSDAPDDSYLWLRALPYADLHVGHFRAFTQPIIAYAVGVAPSASPIDQTRVDMLQAFGEADLGPVTVRAGRQISRWAPNVWSARAMAPMSRWRSTACAPSCGWARRRSTCSRSNP